MSCGVSQVTREFVTWHEKVKQGPQLQNVILDGRSTQQEAVLSTDALACLQVGVHLQTDSWPMCLQNVWKQQAAGL